MADTDTPGAPDGATTVAAEAEPTVKTDPGAKGVPSGVAVAEPADNPGAPGATTAAAEAEHTVKTDPGAKGGPVTAAVADLESDSATAVGGKGGRPDDDADEANPCATG